MQREVESERAAALERYKIDTSVGTDIINKQVEMQHTFALEGLKTSHKAILDGLGAKLDGLTAKVDHVSRGTSEAVNGAHQAIATVNHGVTMDHLQKSLSDVFNEVKHAGKLATAKRVIRKNEKGEIDGIDLLDGEGNVLASHKALKDKSGRVIGMQ